MRCIVFLLSVVWSALLTVSAFAQIPTTNSSPAIISPAQVDPKVAVFSAGLAKAQAGDAEAQYETGIRYQRGEGVKQDEAQALDWLQKAVAEKCCGIWRLGLGI